MDIIERAVTVLSHDGLVIYPTDTLYGLGADAFSIEAIEKVYDAKKRNLAKPISIAVSDIEMLAAVSRIDTSMQEFIERFLPGPVTVVVPAKKIIPDILTGGTRTIGIRIPAHGIARQVIEKFDAPITATSANLSGGKDPQTPDECTVPHDLLIDGGRLPGTPSTVVDLVTRTIVRRGAKAEEIEVFLKHTV
ncbi:L-threonylcarbamoyladenylate synthase [Methanoregula sp. UBA64]|jgi:L-threonylcarbamoyladenylate synthase|uniref:L-threonylcarbamoyladenylate synthase n=1 Tax=Methanoregula sp. UBA64 TaxID=1915554 RepID=UPI0025DC816D|nr:L-threonylcarbamoyladenylate synthase [Methanoregula sp. UBA64]